MTEAVDALGRTRTLVGLGAVACLEAAVSEAYLDGDSPRRERNLFGRRPVVPGGRPLTPGFLAGLADTGLRGAALVRGEALAGLAGELRAGVERRLAYVLHAVLGTGGYRSLQALAASGAFQLAAADPQEAADLSLVAHRLAELALVPGVLALDAEETAHALAPVALPRADDIRAFLGDADDDIESPTPAQAMLFGRLRRRIPDWFSPDLPVLQGAARDSLEHALAEAAGAPFFEAHLPALAARAMEEASARFGRVLAPVSGRHLQDAETVVVAAGATGRLVEAVVQHLRTTHRMRVGSLRLTLLAPFPRALVAERLAGKKAVTILDRVTPPFDRIGPLAAEVEAALGESNRVSVLRGFHDRPLDARDVLAAVENLQLGRTARRSFVLGAEFPGRASAYPKREIYIQRVRREYPTLSERNLRAEHALDLAPPGSLTVVFRSGQRLHAFPRLEEETALLLAYLTDSTASGRTACGATEGGSSYRVRLAPGGPADPGPEGPADVAVVLGLAGLDRTSILDSLPRQGTVLLVERGRGRHLWPRLAARVRDRFREKDLRLYLLDPGETPAAPPAAPARESDLGRRIQGALAAATVMVRWPSLSEERIFRRVREHLGDGATASVERVRAGFDGVRAVNWKVFEAPGEETAAELPLAVRRFKDSGPPVARLTRFWNETFPDYRGDGPPEPVADPFRGAPVLPPATATFFDVSPVRESVPRFVPDRCTGCGKCLPDCPHSALAAVVLGPEALLTAGLERAAASGPPLTQLMPAVRPMAQALAAALRKSEPAGTTTDGLLPAAFSTWIDQRRLDGDKLAEARQEFARLQEALTGFPLAVTELFFRRCESQQKGTGELFSLAVDPQACTGCMACVAVCPEVALVPVMSTPEETTRLRACFRTWEALPDTRADTVVRAAADPEYGPVAAHLLSRSYAFALSGGDDAEPGAGDRIALRWVTSTVEALVQPHVRQLLDEVRDLLNRLGTNVRALFGDALPVDDLETLARSIGDAGERPLRLEDLVDRLGEAGRRRAVDTRRLNRLIELMRSLRDLEWVLAEGPTGIGRARVAMATAGDALEPSCRFPRNPFTFPVAVHWSDDGADFAAGLCRGLLRHALDNLRLVRRARLEAADRYDPRKHDEEIASLDWPELTDEEWSAVPPLLLVGDDSALTGRSAARLGTLLDSELPVKVLILDRRAGGAAGDSDPAAAVGDGLFALAHRNAFVLRTSTANPGHFLEGLAAALRSRRPALVHVYAPSPGRDGFRPDAGRIQSRLATASRAFPCLRYDPDAEGVFGLRLSLDGNPEPEADFARLELEYRDDGESKALALPVTFAHWALGQGRFAAHFTRIAPAVGGMPLDEWLGATPDLRAGKPAFIRSVDPQGDLVHYRVSDAMANAASRAHEAWRVLQELSGLVTPFTAALRKRLEAELAEAHEGEIARVKAEYEERLGRLAEEHHAETAARLRERLLQLSGFGRRPEDTTNGA